MYQLLFRKRWTTLLLMFLTLVIVTGCNEDDPPAIAVSQNLIEVGYERSSTLISVVTNSEWTATSNADWCRLSRTSGRFSTDLDVIVDECASDSKRSATITLSTRGRNMATTTILVSQSAENCSLTITPGEITVGNMGETVAFAVAASPNIEYTVTSSAAWAVPSVKTGKGNGTVKVAVAENVSHSIARSAVVTLAMKNDSEVLLAQFTVHQLSRRMPVIHLGQEAVSFKQDAVTIKENTHVIPVITNITGTLHVTSDFSWCKGEIQEVNGFKFVKITTLSNNEANEARNCIVNITGDVDGEAVTTQILVVQAGLGSPVVTLFRDVVSVDQHVNDITVGYVPATSGIKLDAVSDFPSWIEDVKVNTSLKTITFRVKANQAEESRTGTVTLSAILGDECMVYPITVNQNGLGEAVITITPAQLTLPATISNTTEYLATVIAQTRYSSVTVAVAEGIENVMAPENSWLKVSLVQGANTADDAVTSRVKVVASNNTGNEARTATVILTFKYGTRTIVKSFTVVQAGLGDPAITITNPSISMPYIESTGTIHYTPSSANISVLQPVADQTWIRNVAVSGSTNTITFSLTENKNTEARTGTINVYATRDGVTFTYPVTITQAGYGDVDIRISPTAISLAAADDMTTGTGNVTTSFTVVANHPEAVFKRAAGATDYDWLSISYVVSTANSIQIVMSARPNTTYFDREAIVVVPVEWGNQQVLREVKVTQAHWGGTANMYSTITPRLGLMYVDGKNIWVSGIEDWESMDIVPSEGAVITSVVITPDESGDNWLRYRIFNGAYVLGHSYNETNAPRTATVEVNLRYGNTPGAQTAREVYVVTQGSPLHQIDLSTPQPDPLRFGEALTDYDLRITGIPSSGLDLTTINIEAPEGAIITSIKQGSMDTETINVLIPDAQPMNEKAAFAISAITAPTYGGSGNTWVRESVDIAIQSKDHNGWTRTVTVYIYQSKVTPF